MNAATQGRWFISGFFFSRRSIVFNGYSSWVLSWIFLFLWSHPHIRGCSFRELSASAGGACPLFHERNERIKTKNTDRYLLFGSCSAMYNVVRTSISLAIYVITSVRRAGVSVNARRYGTTPWSGGSKTHGAYGKAAGPWRTQ